MVGRDIGTIVVPDAGLKIYLDAAPLERAIRRFRESIGRGNKVTFADVMRETLGRDGIDTMRAAAPLRAAPDAILINTDALSIDDVVAKIEELARHRAMSTGRALWPV